MADNATLFTKSLFGFSPAEVVAFIEENDAKHASEIKKLNETIAELSAGTESKTAAAKPDTSELDRIRAELDDKNAAIAAQVGALGALQKENAALKADLEDLRIKKTLLEEKVKQYEATVADTESVIERAKKEAERIVAEANEEAKKKADSILREADEMLAESLKKVRALDRRKDELDAMLRHHKESMNAFFDAVDGEEK